MRFRHLQPITDTQTDSHQGDLWQLGRRPSLGSLGRLVLPPSEGHAITTDEPRHRRQAERQSLSPMPDLRSHGGRAGSSRNISARMRRRRSIEWRLRVNANLIATSPLRGPALR